MSSDRARLHLIVSGRVQGVGFRFSARDEATRLGLTGWVRNLPSGEVEMVAEGPRADLRKLSAWAHVGPSFSHVARADENWLDFTGEFSGFQIR
jgi:acylphosphatase